MSHLKTFKQLAAALLAGAALVGCGGGDAEPPPPPVGAPPAGADTTPPTLTIANNVSATVATGPVTFSFVFSEDVGTSFDATDITVNGGTGSAFSRVDGRQATLLVTPTPNTTGTITVDVAAGSFNDLAGNANAAAASASKDYAPAAVQPPPAPTGTVLANFDGVSPPFQGLEGAEGSTLEAGPTGGSGNALKVLRSGGQAYALALITLPAAIPLEAGRKTISARVYSPTAGIPMVIKLEAGDPNVNSGDVAANEAVVVGWQTLTWTINQVNTGYTKIVLLPNLGTVDAAPGKAYYFDDITLLGTASGGGGGAGGATAVLTFDETPAPTLTPFGDNGAAAPAIVADPAGGTNKVLKMSKIPASEQWAGVTVSTGASESIATIGFSATRTKMTMRVYSPAVGVRVRLKAENAGNPAQSVETEAVTTTANAWETLTFDFATPATGTAALDPSKTYNKLSVFSDFGLGNGGGSLPGNRTYYYDDIQLLAAATGGGGGGGGTGTVLANFDSISPPFFGAEGGDGSAVEAGPTGGSGNALKVLRSGGQNYALAVITLPSPIPLEATRKTISARVNSPTAGIPMVIKLEAADAGVNSGEVAANEPVVMGWQTLTWTINTVNTNYIKIVLLPNLGTVDATPGKAYYFDDITLLGTASGGGGGGGGAAAPLTFSTGLAAGNRTIEGGEFGGFSGSNLDMFQCTGGPAWCGGDGTFSPAVAAADSFFYYYYQTPTPATDLYMGIYVLAPGLVGGLSNTGDSPGVQINGQTSIKFKVGQNAEWFGTTTNKFSVDLTLGKRYVVGGNTCRVQLRKVVTPTAAAATVYTEALSGFTVVQDCALGGLTVAAALAASPISQVTFQGAAGGSALTAGGQSTGANRTVVANGVYPTTLVVAGGISFE